MRRAPSDQPTERSASAASIERVAAPRNSSSASTPATTAQTAAPRKTVCSWAMPACLQQVAVGRAHLRLAADLASRSGGRPARRSSGAARSWSAPRCRRASRPSGRPRPSRSATPCTSGSVAASTAALTGASASPKPKPQITSATLDDGSCRVSRPQRDISAKPTADSAMPTAVTSPGAAGADQVAADERADRQRDQEPDQHQRGHQLASRPVDGGPGEDRDVDERGDQGRADEEADHDRAPGRRTTQRAARDAAAPRRGAGAATNATARLRRAEEVPEALVGEDLHLGSAVAKARITPPSASASRQAPAGRPPGRCGPSRAGRPAAASRSRSAPRTAPGRPSPPTPTGVSQRPSPANGMKYSPQVRSRTRLAAAG